MHIPGISRTGGSKGVTLGPGVVGTRVVPTVRIGGSSISKGTGGRGVGMLEEKQPM